MHDLGSTHDPAAVASQVWGRRGCEGIHTRRSDDRHGSRIQSGHPSAITPDCLLNWMHQVGDSEGGWIYASQKDLQHGRSGAGLRTETGGGPADAGAAGYDKNPYSLLGPY